MMATDDEDGDDEESVEEIISARPRRLRKRSRAVLDNDEYEDDEEGVEEITSAHRRRLKKKSRVVLDNDEEDLDLGNRDEIVQEADNEGAYFNYSLYTSYLFYCFVMQDTVTISKLQIQVTVYVEFTISIVF